MTSTPLATPPASPHSRRCGATLRLRTCRPPRPRHVRDTSTARPRRPDLLLDLHLRPHVDQLYADIRSKAQMH